MPVQPLNGTGYRRIIAVNLNPDKKLKLSKFPKASFYLVTPQQQELFNTGIHKVLAFDPKTNFLRICARSAFLSTEIDRAVFLKNGLNLTIHEAPIQMIHNKRQLFLKVSTQMTENSPLGDRCIMQANVLPLAFPDGTRSYVNLNINGEQMYDFPLSLTKGQSVNGYMAFPLPKHIQDFSLIITDMCNNAPAGNSYFLVFTSMPPI